MWIAMMAMARMMVVPAPMPQPVQGAHAQKPDTVVVKMVDVTMSKYAFQPASVTLHPGDVLEFLQTGPIPHDVRFTKTPQGANVSSFQVGPFLTAQGQTYDLTIDGRFPVGHYAYDCVPHAALGMKGTFDVVARTNTSPTDGK